MKCPICKHGHTKPGQATVTLERGRTALVFREVPAEICDNCGETVHGAEVTSALLQQVELAAGAGVEVDVRRFAIAA